MIGLAAVNSFILYKKQIQVKAFSIINFMKNLSEHFVNLPLNHLLHQNQVEDLQETQL